MSVWGYEYWPPVPLEVRGRRQDRLQSPGFLADESQTDDLVIMALESAGHGLELGLIARYMAALHPICPRILSTSRSTSSRPSTSLMLFADEYGHMSYQRILGVEFVTTGNVHSIQDMLSEHTKSFHPAAHKDFARARDGQSQPRLSSSSR